jgi:ADP-ribose pyrophosphatase
MRHYVCGFLFTPGEPFVALIKKTKPRWQAGLYNGIGGKIEDGETPIDAMVREFKEETGCETVFRWNLFCKIVNPAHDSPSGPWTVHFFKAFGVATLQSPTDEKVAWYNCASIARINSHIFVPNLQWLIPMALEDITADVVQHNWQYKT